MTQQTSTTIQSAQHPLIKAVTALAQKKTRLEQNEILVETKHPIEEALKAGLKPKQFFYLAETNIDSIHWSDPTTMHIVTESVMKKLSTTDSTPPCIAVFEAPDLSWQALQKNTTTPLYIVADRMQDPGNLGTLIRTAIAFGATGIILSGQSVDATSPKVIRASAGLIFVCPLVQIQSQADLPLSEILLHDLLSNCQICLTTSHPTWQNQPMLHYRDIDYTKPTVLLLGNEGQGITESDIPNSASIKPIQIPMNPTVESLNVSISAAVILAEAAHQRQK